MALLSKIFWFCFKCVLGVVVLGFVCGMAVGLYLDSTYDPAKDPWFTTAHYQGNDVYYIPVYLNYRHDLFAQALAKMKAENPKVKFTIPQPTDCGYLIYIQDK
ncbi:hypothetical protein C4546_00570 [Candidatus Parcubacteria bacterium]|jgi:hypothetical protein|nr:MAG: hypothetical protein C4546_00570 [Candidatus Parcubacteria bacterium]